ncbi:hypothetical protein CDD81_852 [Ophiocordyceps australis]|uniref:UbiA prenyltransferase n=1 Tax=Ophiocordyceps australis TaxID=1399860 RepID=A0A2C5Y0V9_9HYPO|nr:hypothetical protein CDD81_852 [Ophiocordyceps australis]
MGLRSAVSREVDLFISFTWRDLSATVIPSSLFALGTFKNLDYTTMARNYAMALVWVTLYLYTFNLFTQGMSQDEDSINKPDRPLPCGKVDFYGCMKRYLVALAAFVATSLLYRPIMPETLTWAFITLLHGATQLGGNWFGKNVLAISIGSWTLLSPPRKIMAADMPETWPQIVAASIWAGIVFNIQDFRDQKGDRLVARSTLPLVMGDVAARYAVAFFFAPLGFAALYYLGLAQTAPWLLGGLHLLTSYRILALRSSRADHDTHMLVTYMFCLILTLCSLQTLGFVSASRPVEKLLSDWIFTVPLANFKQLWNPHLPSTLY